MEMGKAISEKIREAIKAKLIDMGNYVDEELPDYIMVMVANKKTESQMKDDLTLFLGTNTDKFSSWLHGVLRKLQAARDEQSAEKREKLKEKKKSKKKDGKQDRKTRSSSERQGGEEEVAKTTDVTSGKQAPVVTPSSQGQSTQPSAMDKIVQQVTPDARVLQQTQPMRLSPSTEPVISLLLDTNDVLDEEIKMSASVKRVAMEPEVSAVLPTVRTESTAEPKSTSHAVVPAKVEPKVAPRLTPKEVPPAILTVDSSGCKHQIIQAQEPVKSRLASSTPKRNTSVSEQPKALPTMSTVVRVPAVSVKRHGPGSVIGQVIHDSDDDCDDEPPVKKIASTVKPRRRPSLPKTKQNSTALLKKAMNQAQKSTSIFPAAGQFSEPVRMIVRSASQSGSIKIVARSLPADKDSHDQSSLTHRKLLTKAVTEARQSVTSAKPSKEKVAVMVRPLGLMSRSKFREASERNFDAHEFQRVEGGNEEEEKEEKCDTDDENEEELEGERQVLEVDMEELPSEEEEEIELQEPVHDTRNTTIVRPLQCGMIAPLQKRISPPSPPKLETLQLVPSSECVNPQFIVTLEGKRRGTHAFEPHQKQAEIMSRYQLPAFRIIEQTPSEAHYERQEEMEDVMTEKCLEYEPSMTMYRQAVSREDTHHADTASKLTPSQQVVKDTIFSPPEPRIEPVTISLEESDEDTDQGQSVTEEKVNERCKFWPACKNGNECPFMHPSTPCRTFPNCKFGDKCLFIHPNCKFDASCMNPTCPFTHATRTKPAAVIIQAPAIRAPVFRPAPVKTVCKFHPSCKNIQCPFLHPKMCRYGTACDRSDCKFMHSTVASRSSLKWTKDKHVSERQYASRSSVTHLPT